MTNAKDIRTLAKEHGGKTRVKGGFANVTFADPMDSADFRVALIKRLGVEVCNQRIAGGGTRIVCAVKVS